MGMARTCPRCQQENRSGRSAEEAQVPTEPRARCAAEGQPLYGLWRDLPPVRDGLRPSSEQEGHGVLARPHCEHGAPLGRSGEVRCRVRQLPQDPILPTPVRAGGARGRRGSLERGGSRNGGRRPRWLESARTGCGAVWLARGVWDAEVAGSNPAIPTTKPQAESLELSSGRFQGRSSGSHGSIRMRSRIARNSSRSSDGEPRDRSAAIISRVPSTLRI